MSGRSVRILAGAAPAVHGVGRASAVVATFLRTHRPMDDPAGQLAYPSQRIWQRYQ